MFFGLSVKDTLDRGQHFDWTCVDPENELFISIRSDFGLLGIPLIAGRRNV